MTNIYDYQAVFDSPNMNDGFLLKQLNTIQQTGQTRRSVVTLAGARAPGSGWTEIVHGPGIPGTAAAIGTVDRANVPDGGGIFTGGQFQCICIIVAIFTPNTNNWSRAWLTHVSSQHAQEVSKMVAKIDANNFANAYVAIAGKNAVLATMNIIKNAFLGIPVPNRPIGAGDIHQPFIPNQPHPETIVLYAGGSTPVAFGFGLRKDGRIGEVA